LDFINSCCMLSIEGCVNLVTPFNTVLVLLYNKITYEK
jgi:hypothetical protein